MAVKQTIEAGIPVSIARGKAKGTIGLVKFPVNDDSLMIAVMDDGLVGEQVVKAGNLVEVKGLVSCTECFGSGIVRHADGSFGQCTTCGVAAAVAMAKQAAQLGAKVQQVVPAPVTDEEFAAELADIQAELAAAKAAGVCAGCGSSENKDPGKAFCEMCDEEARVEHALFLQEVAEEQALAQAQHDEDADNYQAKVQAEVAADATVQQQWNLEDELMAATAQFREAAAAANGNATNKRVKALRAAIKAGIVTHQHRVLIVAEFAVYHGRKSDIDLAGNYIPKAKPRLDVPDQLVALYNQAAGVETPKAPATEKKPLQLPASLQQALNVMDAALADALADDGTSDADRCRVMIHVDGLRKPGVQGTWKDERIDMGRLGLTDLAPVFGNQVGASKSDKSVTLAYRKAVNGTIIDTKFICPRSK